MQRHRKSVELNVAQKEKKNIQKRKEQSVKLRENERFLHVKTNRETVDWEKICSNMTELISLLWEMFK